MIHDLVPLPEAGRRFTAGREVRLGDATVDGRVRLDAIARYLQDVANDDARDAIGADAASWVVRRTTIDVLVWPRFQEPLELTTFCGGTGGRWAERRTTIRGRSGGHVESASLWVHIDLDTGRPAPLPPSFIERFGTSCGDRKVSGRLSHPPPSTAGERRAWSFRATDYDVMGHVNNAAYWAAVEEALPTAAPARFELEYRVPVEPRHPTELVVAGDHLWIVGAEATYASARVVPLGADVIVDP